MRRRTFTSIQAAVIMAVCASGCGAASYSVNSVRAARTIERAKQLEYEEFLNLRETVLESLDAIQDTASALAEIDVLAGLDLKILYQDVESLCQRERQYSQSAKTAQFRR